MLLLHGTAGSGANFLAPAFAGELFGPGQPLDLRRHFVILPDAIGTGGSTKPSDGLRARFPRYSDEDMVDAQYRLVTEGLGILRLIIDSIRNDPDWKGGEYTTQPRSAAFASVFYAVATNGGNQALFKAAPDRASADTAGPAAPKAPARSRRRSGACSAAWR